MTTAVSRSSVSVPWSSRLPSLTGLRFVAAFIVFFTHSVSEGVLRPGDIAPVYRYAYAIGWLGVEFFFILSGFVLTWSERPDDTKSRFWRRRFFKIYPTHLLTWCIALLLALWAGESVTSVQLFPSLFLVHTWAPNLNAQRAINVPSWSLSCEFFFYLSFPWLRALVDRIPAARLWYWLLAVTAVILLLPLVARFALPGTPQLPGQDMSLLQNWFLVSLPPVRALDFILGIVLARIMQTGGRIPLGLPSAGLLVVAGFALQVYFVPGVYGLTATIALPLALFVAAAAKADVNGLASPFRSRVMVRLGEISFALYMTHYLVLHYLHVAFGATESWALPQATAFCVLAFAISMLVSWLSFTYFESQIMRRWGRSKPVPSTLRGASLSTEPSAGTSDRHLADNGIPPVASPPGRLADSFEENAHARNAANDPEPSAYRAEPQ